MENFYVMLNFLGILRIYMRLEVALIIFFLEIDFEDVFKNSAKARL